MALEIELQSFAAQKQQLLEHHAGQLALFKGNELVGIYPTFGEAFNAGVTRFGNVPFLIKPIAADEELAQAPALVIGMLSAHP